MVTPNRSRADEADNEKYTHTFQGGPPSSEEVPGPGKLESFIARDFIHTLSAVTGEPVVFVPGETVPGWARR